MAKNNLQKFSDVQSGPSGSINCEILVGRGAGTLETSGFIVKKCAIQFLDSWSAVVLQAPGIWLVVKVMSKYVVKNHKQHRGCIRSFNDPLLIALTKLILSHSISTHCWMGCRPHACNTAKYYLYKFFSYYTLWRPLSGLFQLQPLSTYEAITAPEARSVFMNGKSVGGRLGFVEHTQQ